jgi:Protein of unknown function (DUF2849)
MTRILTANRLNDGAVVYLDRSGEWTRDLDRAAGAADEPAAGALLAAGERAVAQRLVVAPYLIEVETGKDGLRPLRYRERLRALGPSVAAGPPADAAGG